MCEELTGGPPVRWFVITFSWLLPLLRSKRYENKPLLRTLAGPGGTGYDRCLHVSIVARIVRRREIKFVVIVAVDVVVAQGVVCILPILDVRLTP